MAGPDYASWNVEYDTFLKDAKGRDYGYVSSYLLEQLPYEWRDCYLANTAFPTDIEVVQEGSASYLFDFRTDPDTRFVSVSQSEVRKDARNVATYGRSVPTMGRRPASSSREMLGFIGRTETYLGRGFDKGHFVAHTMGGGVNLNLFPQARHVNRGWSDHGKLYRQMENYCFANLGTMFFTRPFYGDGTILPVAIEFGVLRTDGVLWAEILTNDQTYVRSTKKGMVTPPRKPASLREEE